VLATRLLGPMNRTRMRCAQVNTFFIIYAAFVASLRPDMFQVRCRFSAPRVNEECLCCAWRFARER